METAARSLEGAGAESGVGGGRQGARRGGPVAALAGLRLAPPAALSVMNSLRQKQAAGCRAGVQEFGPRHSGGACRRAVRRDQTVSSGRVGKREPGTVHRVWHSAAGRSAGAAPH